MSSSISTLLPEGWSIECEDAGWSIYDDDDHAVVEGLDRCGLQFQLEQLAELQTEWAIATMCESYKRQDAVC
jgi:hypothetical protein|tara:strand:+ start:3787 stop:4002 length:216 start_codon:yes stop_codon:yes gene_type:complete